MKYLGLFAAAALSLLVAVCSKGNFSERANEGKGNIFRYPIVTNPTTLDPGFVQDGDTIDLLQQVFEGLVAWGPSNTVVPILCEKWDIEDGGKTYVFTIKKGIKFSNGREMTAEDIKWTYERNTDPKLKSPTVEYLYDIVGVKDKVEGNAPEISGIKVRDPYTLTITIDQPRAYFLGKLTYLIGGVMPKEACPADRRIEKAEEMVGTGPFIVKQYVPEQIVVLAANPNYHGGKPMIDGIERKVVKDAATRLAKYKAGEFDLVMLERQDVDSLKQDSKYASELKPFDRPVIWYIAMNQLKNPVFKDRRVRRAFAMAIDKDKIVNELLGGLNTVANGIIPPGVVGHRDKVNGLEYNPAEAKKLLAEAGFPDGKGFPEVEMYFREARPDIRIVAEAASSQLKQNLGVTAKLRTMEWGAYLDKWNNKEIPFYHMRWGADYLDPENFLSFMLATYGPENKLGYSNPEFDALCRKGDALPDGDERLKAYADAEDLVLQDAPWIPIYFQRDFELIRPNVKGLQESLFGHLPHRTVTLQP